MPAHFYILFDLQDQQCNVTGAPNEYPQVLRQGRPILQYYLT